MSIAEVTGYFWVRAGGWCNFFAGDFFLQTLQVVSVLGRPFKGHTHSLIFLCIFSSLVLLSNTQSFAQLNTEKVCPALCVLAWVGDNSIWVKQVVSMVMCPQWQHPQVHGWEGPLLFLCAYEEVLCVHVCTMHMCVGQRSMKGIFLHHLPPHLFPLMYFYF